MKKIILLFVYFLIYSPAFAGNIQNDNALTEYFKQLNNRDFNAIAYLDSLIKLYPDDHRFSYEKSIVRIRETRYDNATSILDSLVKSGVKDEFVYQLLITCYMQANKVAQAFEIADTALVYCPNSARILLEYGYLKKEKNDDITAAAFWEKGINANPYFPENYYPLIENYRKLNEIIWVLMYGEIYMNLSNDTPKVTDISAKVYKSICSILPLNKDSVQNILFTKSRFYYHPGVIDTTEYTFEIAAQVLMNHTYNYLRDKIEFTSSIHTIYQLFNQFNIAWQNSIYKNLLPNPVFDYHKILIDKGLFEAYCFLMYKEGNNKEFDEYSKTNANKLRELIQFIAQNPINLNPPYKVSKLFGY